MLVAMLVTEITPFELPTLCLEDKMAVMLSWKRSVEAIVSLNLLIKLPEK